MENKMPFLVNINCRNLWKIDYHLQLDGQEYLRVTIEVFPSKISYKKDYQEIIADVTAEVYNLAFDAFRRTYDSYSLSGKNGNSPIEFFTIIQRVKSLHKPWNIVQENFSGLIIGSAYVILRLGNGNCFCDELTIPELVKAKSGNLLVEMSS